MTVSIKFIYILLSLSIVLLFPSKAESAIEPFVADVPVKNVKSIDKTQIRLLYNKTIELFKSTQAAHRLVADAEIKELFQQVSASLQSEDEQNLNQARKKLIEAQIRMLPSRPVELRGAFLDVGAIPREEENLRQFIRKLKHAGFNTLFPEVFRRGFTLYQSTIMEQEPLFKSLPFDALRVIVEEARTQQMEVHPWIWVYRVHSPKTKKNPVLQRLPALEAIPYDLNGSSTLAYIERETAAFVSPASPEWRQLIQLMFKEISDNYSIHGYMLDYIRYANNHTEDKLSYTRYQLEYFNRYSKFPPKTFKPGTKYDVAWHLWREAQVNQLVKQLQEKFSNQTPALSIGAAVFRNEVNARRTKLQNWRHWSNNHWLTFASPMLYTNNLDKLDTWLDWETDQNKRFDILYPILGAHRFSDRLDLFNQIHLLQQRHIPGVSVFSIKNLNDETLELLKKGPFRNPATPPHRYLSQAISLQVKSIETWLSNIKTYKPLSQFQQILQLVKIEAEKSTPKMTHIQVKLLGLKDILKKKTGLIPSQLLNEIERELDYTLRLISSHHWINFSGRTYIPPGKPPVAILEEARTIPKINIKPITQAPTIDGHFKDSGWKSASALSPFFWSIGIKRPLVNTSTFVTYDKKALYIGFKNDEPHLEKVQAFSRRHNHKQILKTDDTVEIFLNPGNGESSYYHFAVNLRNTRYQRAPTNPHWKDRWFSAVRVTPKGWDVEIEIPFKTLGIKAPKKETPWKGNFCRRRYQEVDSYHCWSFTFGYVHRTDRFGLLTFESIPEKESQYNEL